MLLVMLPRLTLIVTVLNPVCWIFWTPEELESRP